MEVVATSLGDTPGCKGQRVVVALLRFVACVEQHRCAISSTSAHATRELRLTCTSNE